ncbi:MAG TPA: hypothetical protein PLZ36_14325 [Armatimonadota bacterium]|nr:hypothetical protein [Armatimonadota bacterium]
MDDTPHPSPIPPTPIPPATSPDVQPLPPRRSRGAIAAGAALLLAALGGLGVEMRNQSILCGCEKGGEFIVAGYVLGFGLALPAAWGLLRGRRWGWTLALLVSGAGAALGIVGYGALRHAYARMMASGGWGNSDQLHLYENFPNLTITMNLQNGLWLAALVGAWWTYLAARRWEKR